MKSLMKLLTIPLLMVALTATALAGIKIKVKKGDISGIVQYKKVKIDYVYDGMMVGRKMTEEEYVAKRVAEKNEKEAGKGDAWKEAWISARSEGYQPKFEKLVNKYMNKLGVTVTGDEEAPDMVMTVRVTRLEPGFYAYVTKRPAELDLEITLADPSEPTKKHAVLTLTGAPGSPLPTVGMRVSEAFAKAGKDFGKYLSKKGK